MTIMLMLIMNCKVLELRGSVGRARDHAIPLVRVRNPHGDHKEWRGAWSDGDAKWDTVDDNRKERLGVTKKNDGEFYMHFRYIIKVSVATLNFFLLQSTPPHPKKKTSKKFDLKLTFFLGPIFRDFLHYYGELEICHLGPDSFGGKVGEADKKFESSCFLGEWKAGENSGGCGNDGFCEHQFLFIYLLLFFSKLGN